MKKIASLISILLISCTFVFAGEKLSKAPFTKGVNLTGWFEMWSPGVPNLELYHKSDFEDLQKLGCDVIRLPIHFDMFVVDQKTQKVNEIIFDYLDKACDWAEELGIFLVVDNHSFNQDPYPGAPEVKNHLEKIWPQIAKRYKDRSAYILYEILNEPRIQMKDWEDIQASTLKAIRKIDKRHTVVVSGSDWGSLDSLRNMKLLNDDNLIYTFHCYDPFVFTHQGASWCDKYMSALKNVPFPYDKNRLPKMEGILKGSYIESNLNHDYKKNSSREFLKATLQKGIDFSARNNVAVWVGEMGVYSKEAPYEDRLEWFRTMGSIYKELNLPFCVWGYDDQFGFFKKGSRLEFPYDLDLQIVEGLGMKVPDFDPSERSKKIGAIEIPFQIYSDFYGKDLSLTTYSANSATVFNMADKTNPAEGKFCIKLADLKQYGSMDFIFKRIDLSQFNGNEEKYCLSMKVKFTSSRQALQLRFIMNDEIENGTYPWRLAYDLKAFGKKLNEWQQVEIPLSSFRVTGGWSGKESKWYAYSDQLSRTNPFDWSQVNALGFAAENGDLLGEVFFDDIKIVSR